MPGRGVGVWRVFDKRAERAPGNNPGSVQAVNRVAIRTPTPIMIINWCSMLPEAFWWRGGGGGGGSTGEGEYSGSIGYDTTLIVQR